MNSVVELFTFHTVQAAIDVLAVLGKSMVALFMAIGAIISAIIACCCCCGVCGRSDPDPYDNYVQAPQSDFV